MPFYETATLRVPELLFVPQIWIKSWTTMRCALACRNRKRGRKITWRSCRNRFAGTTYSCVSLSLVNKLRLRKFIIRPSDSQKFFFGRRQAVESTSSPRNVDRHKRVKNSFILLCDQEFTSRHASRLAFISAHAGTNRFVE